MSRFRIADDVPTPFSQARPDKHGYEDYEPPTGEPRGVDDAPENDERLPSPLANVGYAKLKRR